MIGGVVGSDIEEVPGDVNEFGSRFIERITRMGDIEFGTVERDARPEGEETPKSSERATWLSRGYNSRTP